MTVTLHRHSTLTPAARRDLLTAYADVRSPLLHLPNYSVTAFTERLERHAAEPGFTLVLGRHDGEPVGYAYATSVGPGDPFWERLADPLPEGFTAAPALALREIGVRTPWRGTGTARRIHDALLAARPEGRTVLMVNPLAGEGRVRRRYEDWGYRAVNRQAATAHSPELTVMIRPTR
ncbi:GNAT family N-acetyltransferase [Kitasatospora sp. NPDC096147]|uniref:GNAT family N-acetyltransferase n=1 Tax=Kitasatospora sp. NPDC096147 TaxID=3364093 RepID=UPI003811DA94